MIIEIDGYFFNPLLITTMNRTGDSNVEVWFTDSEFCLTFKNWKVSDLAAHINKLIEEFNKK